MIDYFVQSDSPVCCTCINVGMETGYITSVKQKVALCCLAVQFSSVETHTGNKSSSNDTQWLSLFPTLNYEYLKAFRTFLKVWLGKF